MRCIRCNSEVAEGMKFCPYCGNPMTIQQQPQQSYQQYQQGQYQQSQQPYQQPYQGQYQQNQSQQSYQGQTLGQYRQPYLGQYQRPLQEQYQQQSQDHPLQERSQTGAILKLVEYLFYILSIADFFLGRFGIVDITGFAWSPLLFVVVGAVIGQYVKHKYGITDDEK